MGWFNKKSPLHVPTKTQPVAPKPKKEAKCKIKFKIGKDGSETFEATGCTEEQTRMAVQMRTERSGSGRDDGYE